MAPSEFTRIYENYDKAIKKTRTRINKKRQE